MPMHCPQCLIEYRDGFMECADCRIPLKSGPPPDLASSPAQPRDHGLDVVTVLETDDSFALTLAKSALDDGGIEYIVIGDDPRYIPGFEGGFGLGAIPFGGCSCSIQVARESEDKARALLEPLQNP